MSGILDASLQVATALIAKMSASEREHEETLTGTLLGSLLASNSLLSLFTAHLDVPATQCWWGSNSKYRSKEMDKTEAGSGADFALLTLPEVGRARLAIFQAKRGEVKDGKWIFDANRVPQAPTKDDADARESQMLVLVETAKRLGAIADPKGARVSRLHPVKADPLTTQAQIDEANLGLFDWIHYLVYTSDGVECIALRYLSQAYLKEATRKRSKTAVSLRPNSVPFLDIVAQATSLEGPYWLEFEDAKTAIDALPHLLPLVPVVVGDGSGRHGPQLAVSAGLKPLTLDFSAGPLPDLVGMVFDSPSTPTSTIGRPS